MRRRSRADRVWLDQRLAATFAYHDGELSRIEPDELVGAAERAVDELCDLARRERDEAEAVAESFVAVQPRLTGGARLYGELDATAAATVVGAVERAAADPHRDEAGQAQPTAASGWSTTGRSRQYATALVQICGQWAGGHPTGGTAGGDGAPAGGVGPVTGRAPKPVIRVGVDLAAVTASTAGTVDVGVRGLLPRLTAAAVEALACDATVQAVLFDGARPLTATDKLAAADVPAKIRTAVEHRDRGCRWPGCDAPLAHCEVHHLVARAMGGNHHPENLACLCRVDHLRAHHHHWHLELDGATGALAGYRHGAHIWTTQPRGTPLAAAAPRDPPATGGDRDPPTDGDDGDEPPPGWGAVVDDDDGNPLPF